MSVFEDKLRARIVYLSPAHSARTVMRTTEEERDALAELVAAVRAELYVVAQPPRGMFPTDDRLRDALDRLDAS